MLLVADQVGTASTSMAASSEAALAALVWTPATVLTGYLSVRSTGPSSRRDALALRNSRAQSCRRALTALAAPLALASLGWASFWTATSIVAARAGVPLYWSMSVTGFAMGTVGTTLGCCLGTLRAPAWVAACVTGAAYLAGVIWNYIPSSAAEVLVAPYYPLFLSDALPSTGRLGVQAAWAGTVLLIALASWSGILRRGAAAAALAAAAVACSAATSWTPATTLRSDRLVLDCHRYRGLTICTWPDHRPILPALRAGADRARRLTAGTGLTLPAALTESDSRGTPSDLSSRLRADVVVLLATTRADSDGVAAALVSAALARPSGCPVNTRAPGAGPALAPASAARSLVELNQWEGREIDDPAIHRWLVAATEAGRRCEPAPLP